jgi:photosystem II stability/assembly factor-like uncharacterized protein
MKRIVGILLAVMLIGFFVELNISFTGQTKEKETDKPLEPTDWFLKQRIYPNGTISPEVYEDSRSQAIAVRQAAGMFKSGQEDWELVGPYNVGGRITDVEMHPSDTETIYVTAASGGIYKSVDKGKTWRQVFENHYTLSIGDMAIAKTDKNLIYVGTGEPNIGQGSLTYDGYGVFKSTDGGLTWEQAGLENAGSIGRVAIDPSDPDRVFVAALGNVFTKNPERGVYRTLNGGESWENVFYISDSTGCIDLCINPQDPDIVYAAMWERVRFPDRRTYGGPETSMWKSTDGGDNWTKLTNGLPQGSMGRIGIDISESNPDILYAVYANTDGSFKGAYKTVDGGSSWTELNTENVYSSPYTWWFSEMDIHPNNPDIVWMSDFYLYKTEDGGSSFETVSGLHVDQHGVYIHPAETDFVVTGNDGGVYLSNDGTASNTFVTRLPITQFYTCEVNFQDPEQRFGGTQDNGTVGTFSGSGYDWASIYGGDGFIVKIDPSDPRFIYASSQRGGVGRSTNGGDSFRSMRPAGGDRYNWKTPYILDPNTPSTLYLGSHRVYKSTTRGSSWSLISDDLTNGDQPPWNYGTITSIAVSKLNPDKLIAGTDDGNVWVTENQGQNKDWTKVSDNLPVRWVTSVAMDHFDENTAFVAFSGLRYHDYVPHVFRTRDFGQTWEDISSNLPDLPVNNITIDPDNQGTYYLATDNGVYVSYDGGEYWEILGNGMPTVPVLDLNLHSPTRTLLAATFGRSMWRIPLKESSNVDIAERSPSGLTAYPNPSDGEVIIEVNLNKATEGQIYIFDLSGRQVRNLHNGFMPEGRKTYSWDGGDSSGQRTAGIYICRIVTPSEVMTSKIQIQ